MSIADTCEESAFEHGRSVAIEGFTTKEITDELSKREGVTNITVTEDERTGFCYIVNGDDKATKVYGAAKILVVKE